MSSMEPLALLGPFRKAIGPTEWRHRKTLASMIGANRANGSNVNRVIGAGEAGDQFQVRMAGIKSPPGGATIAMVPCQLTWHQLIARIPHDPFH